MAANGTTHAQRAKLRDEISRFLRASGTNPFSKSGKAFIRSQIPTRRERELDTARLAANAEHKDKNGDAQRHRSGYREEVQMPGLRWDDRQVKAREGRFDKEALERELNQLPGSELISRAVAIIEGPSTSAYNQQPTTFDLRNDKSFIRECESIGFLMGFEERRLIKIILHAADLENERTLKGHATNQEAKTAQENLRTDRPFLASLNTDVKLLDHLNALVRSQKFRSSTDPDKLAKLLTLSRSLIRPLYYFEKDALIDAIAATGDYQEDGHKGRLM